MASLLSMMDANQGAVTVSPFQLVQELCEQFVQKDSGSSLIFINTFQVSTKQAAWSTRDNTKMVKAFFRVFYDTVLLRRWEWYGLADSAMTPACSCMSFGYHLLCQGKHDEAGRLVEAVSSLSDGRSMLKEPEAVLTFLSLLADVEMDSHQTEPVVQPMKEGEPFRYEIYPSSYFEKPPEHSGLTHLDNEFSQSLSLFECAPGTGFSSFLSQPPGIEGKTDTLYDGLVHSTVKDLNTPLGLPQLPTNQEDFNLMPHKEYKNPSSECSSSLPADCSSLSSMPLSSTLFSLFSSDAPETIREWEGWKIGPRQYLCDDCESFPHAVELCLSRYCSLAGVDVCEVQRGGCVVDTVIRTLDTLPMDTLKAFEDGGSVSRMFGEAVQSLLDYFRAQLHQLAGGSTDLQLSLSSHWILPTVQFLVDIWNDVHNLPKGPDLLDTLYAQACQIQGTPYYLLLLNLMAQSLAPYFKFVEQWVFQGWLDLGEEFGLLVNEEALAKRDEDYWNKGFTRRGDSGCAPSFLASQAHTILTCGKALNLLRICKPSHPLCTGMFHPPKLKVQLSRSGLEQCNVQCQQYGRDVQENEQVRHELLKQMLQAREEELRAEVLKARQEARAHAEKLKKLEEAYKAQEREKKTALRTELLEQIRTNQVLRSEQEAEERLQDRERMEHLSSKETFQTEQEYALQEKAKEEMIQYYSELSREAELRRLRAEWRAKRYELSIQRFEFLRREREMITAKSARSSTQTTPAHRATTSRLTAGENSRSVSLNASLNAESAPSVVRKTWAEGSSQADLVTGEETSRKTWIASMVEQPVAVDVADSLVTADGSNGDCILDESLDADSSRLSTPSNVPTPTVPHHTQSAQSYAPSPIQGKQSPLPSAALALPHPPVHHPSVVQDLLYNRETTDPPTLSRLAQITVASPHLRAASKQQASTAQDLIYPTEHAQSSSVADEGAPRLVSSRGCEPPSTAQDIIYDLEGQPDSSSQSRGKEPESTAQGIIYSTDWADGSDGPLIQEQGHPRLVSTRGHAPDSTAQLKMYPLRYLVQEEEVATTHNREHERPSIEFTSFMKYKDDFTFLGSEPTPDMLTAVLGPSQEEPSSDVDTEFLSVYPVAALVEQSLALPILTQSALVNEALLRYFLTECRITYHFNVLKWFLLLEDGEFGHALSTRLCEELAYGRDWKRLCSASFLNPILTAALEVSVHSHCPEAQRISFALKYRPSSINTHTIDALEFLQLKYQVDWPCNIVITTGSLEKYNTILQLLLQMKRSSWALKNTFHQLKVCKALNDSQTRQLQVYRHEYQHFINVMHGYIANQVFQITWREFECDLQNEVDSFEDLIQAHHSFVNKAIFRCLLSKKAIPVMKLIQNIFRSILKFSSQLTGDAVNVQRSYAVMCETHTRFREVSGLLIKVVDKLVQRGYQPHLEDLLLRLDFNGFYRQSLY